ncbi:Zona pellucida domain containing protein [Trichuris trichiura]|uniref:Zona pellucida domain containing protein n=1 Tax=Trichuris trichiura TaxID=36087 RepID=A0A077ZH96_TRITR|nr:Zona pellucida domain containing protein [Trichuris trichiura]
MGDTGLLDRSVECNSEEITVDLHFAKPFNGIVFANKFYQTPQCRWEGDGSHRLQLRLPLNPIPTKQPYCGLEHTEFSQTDGEYGVTLVLSPMRDLLVEGMEGLTVRCAYNMDDITLTLPTGINGPGLLISPRTYADVVTGSGGSPLLKMVIRDGHGIQGSVVDTVHVGQRVTLDVIMEDTSIYDFYVHDCYAHDGTNIPETSISIIDQDGCATQLSRAVDVPAFTTTHASTGAKHVYVHMYGFQFTTSQLVYVQCQVRPCLQNCNRPQCQVTVNNTTLHLRRKRTHANSWFPLEENYNLTAVIRVEQQELQSIVPTSPQELVQSARTEEFCIDLTVAILLLTVFAVVCLLCLSIMTYLCRRLLNDSPKDPFSSCSVSTPTSRTSYSR